MTGDKLEAAAMIEKRRSIQDNREDAAMKEPAGTGQGRESSTDEMALWMSLALDEALDPAETTVMQAILADDERWAAEWLTWREIDHALYTTPAVDPPANFMGAFERRLDLVERRRRLWLGVLFGVIYLAMWGTICTGLVALGTFVVVADPASPGLLIRTVAYVGATVQAWYDAAVMTAQSLLAMPQTWLIVGAYGLAASAILALWAQFLRWTTYRRDEAAAA